MRAPARGILAVCSVACAVGVGVVLGARVAAPLRARRAQVTRVAPELRSPLLYPPVHLTSAGFVRLTRRLPTPPARLTGGASVEIVRVPGAPGAPDVEVYLYRPARRRGTSGALLWMHGGGYVIGHPASDHALCQRLASEAGVLVASVNYRLAPENPYPAGLADCYAALAWVHARAGDLGVDTARVAVGGASAGGGLAAALAQLAHDRAECPIRLQLLVYPMIDDRTVLRADHAGTGEFVWSPASNRFGWTSYLGRAPEPGSAPEYAVPARRAELAGLPPAWIGVGELDLFRAEDELYADRLVAAGVPCQLHLVPGMYHGADVLKVYRTPLMADFLKRIVGALRAAVGEPAAAPGVSDAGEPAA